MRLEQTGEGRGREERRIAGQDEDVPLEALERRLRGGGRVTGSAWLLLDGERGSRRSVPSSSATVPGEVTTTSGSGSSSLAAAMTQSTRRRPSSSCRCFGRVERMRVPRPAAITTAAMGERVTRTSWLGREDSNLRSRDQNPLPYHLATPH